MPHLRKYTKEQLIALARDRGIYPPEDATDEELKRVERRLSAERGWIVEPPPPQREWRDSHYSREADRIAARDREAAAEASTPTGRVNDRSAVDRRRPTWA
jgi:hypothetical protein